MKAGIWLSSLTCLTLAGAAAAFFVLTSKDERTPSQTASIIVYLDTMTTAADTTITATATSTSTTAVTAEITATEAVTDLTETEIITELPVVTVEFPIDINAASVDELMLIPEIGETLANRIVAHREACGGFTRLSQILEVDGIGEGRYESIVNYIYIRADQLVEETQPTEAAVQPEIVTSATEWIPVILDVNEASVEDFDYLPGVDRELAENIVELRENIKYFLNPLELLYAEGMTTEIYVSIRDYLVCNKEDDG